MRYLYSKDDLLYAECENCGRVLKFKKYQISEIKTGVECFCGSISDTISNFPTDVKSDTAQLHNKNNSNNTSVAVVDNKQDPTVTNTAPPIKHIPSCPTCGSTNIQRISLASKAIGGYMFGIFSSNVRNTFRCNNCGYKW